MKYKKKHCPKCKSENVRMKMTALTGSLGSIPDWKCNECGYQAKMFPDKKLKRKERK